MSKRYWEWPPVFKIKPEKTALLIIDMQKGQVEKGAPLEVPMAREQVPAIKKLLNFCRGKNISVIFTKFCVGTDFKYPFYWAMAKQRGLDVEPPKCMFWDGKHETEIIPELRPRKGERIVKKCGYDAFANTELDQILHSHDIKYLIITGTVTNWCVDSTIRSAFHRFYNIVIVADGVSTFAHAGASAKQWQDMELDFFAEAFGRVMTAEDVIKELSGA
jgi:ureidoacrylate peracid hydrolase